ncbi:lasso RiPP family leader peptide-containing protein [Halorubrum ezzemoulense]
MKSYEKPELSELGDISDVTENRGNPQRGPPFSPCPGNSESANKHC